jgi:hypothetical protein
MQRAKYKIGTLIQFFYSEEVVENQTESKTGPIDAVVTRTTGYSYLVEGRDQEVPEEAVLAAFRPIKERQARGSKPKNKNSAKKTAKETQLTQ